MSELAKAKQVLVSAAGSLPADTDLQTVVEGLLASQGVEEAPDDGEMYARKEEDWVKLGSASSVDVGDGSDEVPTNGLLGTAAYEDIATIAEAGSGVSDKLPTVTGVAAEINALRPKATTAEAQAGAANKYPDAAGVKSYVGQFGIGESVSEKVLANINLTKGGIFGISASDPDNPSTVSPIVVHAQAGSVFGGGLLFDRNINPKGWLYSVREGVVTSREIWSRGNTTVDSNGFIKQASPIINLYSDHIEPNDSLEVANAEFEHVGVGHYILRNVPLLSRDGWYIETPKDRNNNIYFTIDYDESVEGELTIRTYEPDYSTGRATNGEPIDILEGRFVSLRFMEIPELYPQPTEEEEVLENEETIISDAVNGGADSV